MLIAIIIIIFFLLLGAFFSGSEIAIISTDKIALASEERKGSDGAAAVRNLLARPEWFFSLCLFGTNLSIVGSTTVATFTIIHYLGEEYRFIALLLSLVILLMSEVVPKAVFQHYADEIAPRVAPMLQFFSMVFYPFVWIFAYASRKLLGRAGMLKKRQPLVTKDQIERMFGKSAAKGAMKPMEAKMVKKILRLPEKKIKDIMRPLVDVTGLSDITTIGEALDTFGECGFSRIPVFARRITDIVGILHTFDILYAKDMKMTVKELMRPAEYIHENQPADDTLAYMERKNIGTAVAVDEYGGAVGVITFEDILEEVVGDIEDECEVTERPYRKIGPGQYVVDARVEVDRVNDELGLSIKKEGDFETLGGFLIDRFGKIPSAGDVIREENITFTVKEATKKSVEEVVVEVTQFSPPR